MEQAITTLIQNAVISALSLIALALALWLALMAIFGATLAVAHYNTYCCRQASAGKCHPTAASAHRTRSVWSGTRRIQVQPIR